MPAVLPYLLHLPALLMNRSGQKTLPIFILIVLLLAYESQNNLAMYFDCLEDVWRVRAVLNEFP